MAEYLDVIVVGAGISGISAGYHLGTNCPGKRYAILESRDSIGGTWDLFRYPGVRSDSDMETLGFGFRPWLGAKSISDGPSILQYVKDTAAHYGIDKHIRYAQRLTNASWNTETALWTVTVENSSTKAVHMLECRFLIMGTGYYKYTDTYRPEFAGSASFKGQIIHPQFWPEKLDYAGKQVLVIGSGATAVTIVPAMADKAAHVTMLQRSPTYFVSRPSKDVVAIGLRRILPERLAYNTTRWKNIIMQHFFFTQSQKRPKFFKNLLIKDVRKNLGSNYDIITHFTPRYFPWQQRLCLVPDGDFFNSLNSGKASVVTDTIDCFTDLGVKLASGKELPADIIITATGLKMEVMSGVQLVVDGKSIKLNETISYKGFMYSDVPNLASSFGYSNASWTLKADLICNYVTRLINHLDETGNDYCVAHPTNIEPLDEPIMNLTSGYVQRALGSLPKQGATDPWKIHHNYFIDRKLMKFGDVADGVMAFSKAKHFTGAARPVAVAAE